MDHLLHTATHQLVFDSAPCCSSTSSEYKCPVIQERAAIDRKCWDRVLGMLWAHLWWLWSGLRACIGDNNGEVRVRLAKATRWVIATTHDGRARHLIPTSWVPYVVSVSRVQCSLAAAGSYPFFPFLRHPGDISRTAFLRFFLHDTTQHCLIYHLALLSSPLF